ncbi:MAG: hypothetical protein JRI23_26315 [Deltaproteobacteria bacterium]|jgi:hypothetical protein|nr:hypothetical protein [Deltaproteobacteria bacterium]MBW2535551.1 hypothetical protein [Deltaproteobacteria bacterium]
MRHITDRFLPALTSCILAAAAFGACGDDEDDGSGAAASTGTGTASAGGGGSSTGGQGGTGNAGNQGGTAGQGGGGVVGGQGGAGGAYQVATVCLEACEALVACDGAGGAGGGTTLLECTPPCNAALSTCASGALGEVLGCVTAHLDSSCDDLAYWTCVDGIPCVGEGGGGA